MASYFGRFSHSMTDNGRVSLPSKYRRDLPENLVAVPSPNKRFKSLFVFSEEGFDQWLDEIFEAQGGFDAANQDHIDLRSEYYDTAEPLDVDKSGRITISEGLRNYASLGGEIYVTGQRTYFCLWNPADWEAYQEHRTTLSLIPDKAQR